MTDRPMDRYAGDDAGDAAATTGADVEAGQHGAGLAGSATTESSEPSALESRYRRLLRVLPRAYREAREQEMVDTFLDSEFGADPQNADLTAKFGGVGWGEAVSVLALAFRLRWADPQAPPRFRVRVAALPLATLGFLTVLAVSAAVGVCSRLWLLAYPPKGLTVSPLELAFPAAPGIWPFLSLWSFVLWIPALALALSGRSGPTTIATLLAAVPAAVRLIEAVQLPGVGLQAGFDWALAAVQCGVVAALAGMSAGARNNGGPAPRGYALAALAGFAGYEVITAVAALHPPDAALIPLVAILFGAAGGPTGFWFVATGIAAAVLAVRRARGTRPAAATLLALAAVGAATTLLLLAGLPTAWQMDAQGEPLWDALFVATVIQCALAAAISVTAGFLAARRIRRLPPVSY